MARNSMSLGNTNLTKPADLLAYGWNPARDAREPYRETRQAVDAEQLARNAVRRTTERYEQELKTKKSA